MQKHGHCTDEQCVCKGQGDLVWAIDLYRWRYQLLCNTGGLIFLEVADDIEVYDYVGDTPVLKGNPVRDAPPLPGPDDYIRCASCNRLLIKTGRNQKFCANCAKEAHKLRKREWIHNRRTAEKESLSVTGTQNLARQESA